MDVSENSDNPKSSISKGFSIIYKPSILGYPLFLETPIYPLFLLQISNIFDMPCQNGTVAINDFIV